MEQLTMYRKAWTLGTFLILSAACADNPRALGGAVQDANVLDSDAAPGPVSDAGIWRDGSSEAVDPAQLTGTWAYEGHVPAFIHLTMTLKTDGTVEFRENVSPTSLPAGSSPAADSDGCRVTQIVHGSYTVEALTGRNVLTWRFTEGRANEVTGCNDLARSSPGTAMTLEGVHAFIEHGLLPAESVTFVLSEAALTLQSEETTTGLAGVGRGFGSTFRRESP